MPGGWELVATSGIVLAAGVIVGLAGFGFALFAVPPLLFIHEPAEVVALVNLLGFGSGVSVLLGEWREIRRPALLALLPWALPGLAAGNLLLRSADGRSIKLMAGIVVSAFALYATAGFRIPGIDRPAATAVAGLSSGVLGASVGLGGPPIALLFTGRSLPPGVFRVTIAAYFMVINMVAVALLAATGVLERRSVALALALAPASLVGRWCGRRLADRVSPAAFRRIVLALLLLTGATGAIGALLA